MSDQLVFEKLNAEYFPRADFVQSCLSCWLKLVCPIWTTGVFTSFFIEWETERVLLADASNAIIELNRQLALLNMNIERPNLAKFLINFYKKPAKIFSDREKLSPQEGTNQSRPEGLPLNGVALLPLFKRLRDPVKQFLYTDDSAAEVESLIK